MSAKRDGTTTALRRRRLDALLRLAGVSARSRAGYRRFVGQKWSAVRVRLDRGGLQAVCGTEVVGGAGAAGQGGVILANAPYDESKHPRDNAGHFAKLGYRVKNGAWGWTAYKGRDKVAGPHESDWDAWEAIERHAYPKPLPKIIKLGGGNQWSYGGSGEYKASDLAKALRAERLARAIEGLAVRAAQGAFAAGHKFWGNQWSEHAQHPEGDPVGEPSGKIRHAVLVIGGKRYKGPSHFQALTHWMKETGNDFAPADMEWREGFETESGHFLARQQSYKYSTGDTNDVVPMMRSELLHLSAVDGKLYTQDAVQAALPYYHPAQEHSDARDAAEVEYRKKVAAVVGALEAEALAARERKEAAKAKKKRRDEFLAALALLLLYAGMRIYRSTRSRLAIAIPGWSPGGAAPTSAPPAVPGGISVPPMPSGLPGAGGVPNLGHLAGDEGAAEEFAKLRAVLLEAFPKETLDQFDKVLAEGEAEGMSQADLAERLHEEAQSILAGRGELVAQTEAQATYGSAQLRLLQQAGFLTKVWQTCDDDKVRPSHVECGEQGEVPIGKPFLNGLLYPGDPRGGPEEVINCRCWLTGGSRKPGAGHPEWWGLKASEAGKAT